MIRISGLIRVWFWRGRQIGSFRGLFNSDVDIFAFFCEPEEGVRGWVGVDGVRLVLWLRA
jgi:hypothetical protein